MAPQQLIVALDAPFDRACELYRMLKPLGVAFKIGVPMLLEPWGRLLARDIAIDGYRLMLDLKLFDTRDTVLRAMDAAARLRPHLITVQEESIPAAMEYGASFAVLAVRQLTDGTMAREDVAHLGKADGIVCPSVRRAAALRRLTDKLLVCPGIRPAGSDANNHKRPATPAEARAAGADYIVVGRPIYEDPDPVGAAQRIIEELA